MSLLLALLSGGGATYTINIAESVGAPTDVVARAFLATRAVPESMSAPTDAVTRSVTYARTVSENVPAPTDSVSRAVAFLRNEAESVAASADAVTRTFAANRAVGESVSAPTDTLTRSLVLLRAIAENVPALADSLTRSFFAARAAAETVSAPTDAVARTFVANRAVAENVPAPTDSVSRIRGALRAIGESVAGPTDSVTRTASFSRGEVEVLGAPTDSVARTFVGLRALAESIGAPTDSVSRVRGALRAIAESILAPTDSVAGSVIPGPGSSQIMLTTKQKAIVDSLDAKLHSAFTSGVLNPDASVNSAQLLAYAGLTRPPPLDQATVRSIFRMALIAVVSLLEEYTEVGAALAPAFQNSWVNFGGGFATAAFKRDFQNYVTLKGKVTGGTSPSVIFTLPVGYRPSTTLTFICQGHNTGGNDDISHVEVDSSGAVTLASGSRTWTSLDNIAFFADQ